MRPGRSSTFRKGTRLGIALALFALATPAFAVLTIEERLARIEKRSAEPVKDFWDKLAAASGLVSGIMVALIGFYATGIYNKRQKAAEERRRDQEILVAQIQTVEKYLPYLSGTDEAAKSVALVAISLLGNPELAIKLAAALHGPGATNALTTIAAGTRLEDPAVPESARAALSKNLDALYALVASVVVDNTRRAAGFVVSSDGWIITAAHVVQDMPVNIAMMFEHHPSNPYPAFYAQLLAIDSDRDLALLQIPTPELLPSVAIEPASPIPGETITALNFGQDGTRALAFGTISGLTEAGPRPGIRAIVAKLAAEPGSSGAPVVNGEGRLLGLIQAHDQNGNTYLIDAAEIFAFVKEQRVKLSAR
ncbi:MAG: serine protease [Pseudomonadota bacterium]